MPDSTIQINNTFGKIVLKSYQVDSTNSNPNDDLVNLNALDDGSSEFSFLNNSNHFDVSQLLSTTNRVVDNIDLDKRKSIQNYINNNSYSNAKRATSLNTNARNSYQQPSTSISNRLNSFSKQTSINNDGCDSQNKSISNLLPSTYDDTRKSIQKNINSEEKSAPTEQLKTKSFIPGKELLTQANPDVSSNKKILNMPVSHHQAGSSFDTSRLRRIDYLKNINQEKETF